MIKNSGENPKESMIRSAKRTRKPYDSKATKTKTKTKEKNIDEEKNVALVNKDKKDSLYVKPLENRSITIKQEENTKPIIVEKEKTKDNTIFKKPKLKIIPLGGLHEIGKNITIFSYEDES